MGVAVHDRKMSRVPSERASTGRLGLPQVTLCAVTSVNVQATMRALEICVAQIEFAACKLFTDADIMPNHSGIEVLSIARLGSAAAYSDFLLTSMVDHVETSHCLVIQWDGHAIDAGRWLPEFLDYDYIGASWPQFDDGHDVGNGGFSLRSRRLLELCRDPGFLASHPEDIAICRVNRDWLECRGMRFAPKALADNFSAERAGDPSRTFGYHGAWNMPRVIGAAEFWRIYRDLDDRSTIRHDIGSIARDVGSGPGGLQRMARIFWDHLGHKLRLF